MLALACVLVLVPHPQDPPADAFAEARARAAQSRRAVSFCLRYADGWLRHADPRSGLLPRTLRGDAFWNAKDCAADNWPFLALTGLMTGQHHLQRAAAFLLEQETRLCSRVDGMPDDFVFATQGFRPGEPKLDDVIFGAAEYCKDGLLPMHEWAGPGPWTVRLVQLLRALAAHSAVESPAGKLPSKVLEVNGDLLQAWSRGYWLHGDPVFATMAFRLGDHYLLHRPLLAEKVLPLRDHGCEAIGGLAEAYVLAAAIDPGRRERWRAPLHALLDCVLAHGVRPDGLLHNAIDPQTGAPVGKGASDGWGYVLDAVLTVAMVDDDDRYRAAVRDCVQHVVAADCATTPGLEGADGCADTVEGALNLLQRLPEPGTSAWVDRQIEILFAAQRSDGILEAWYGDGNSARTMWMWAHQKTAGAVVRPWREDVALGGERAADGTLRFVLHSDFAWLGELCCERPRARDVMHLPFDYPRINQWPEWAPVDRHERFEVTIGTETRTVNGAELWHLPVGTKPGQELTITARPLGREALRQRAFPGGDGEAVRRWQQELRQDLRQLLAVTDHDASSPLQPRVLSSHSDNGMQVEEIEVQSTAGRRMVVHKTSPPGGGPWPAVVCIHGHGGTRASTYDASTVYRGFAASLAARGFVTIACDVGQHDVQEAGRTLLGERLWDLQRCVDLLATDPIVDPARIGCAGLSLGGEMAMWLGALDERIAATVSCGFLTTMDQLEQGHCLCWKLPGLRQRVDFADLYALIAPRALQCQNGLAEPASDFCVPLARQAMAEVARAYAALAAPDAAKLHVHAGAHEVDVQALVGFLQQRLASR